MDEPFNDMHQDANIAAQHLLAAIAGLDAADRPIIVITKSMTKLKP